MRHTVHHSPGAHLPGGALAPVGDGCWEPRSPHPTPASPPGAPRYRGNECVFAHPLPNPQQFKEKRDEAELRLVLHPGSSFGPGRLMAGGYGEGLSPRGGRASALGRCRKRGGSLRCGRVVQPLAHNPPVLPEGGPVGGEGAVQAPWAGRHRCGCPQHRSSPVL